MKITLDVPEAERDLARRRGATWDRGRKVFYVENPADLRPFQRWILAPIVPRPEES